MSNKTLVKCLKGGALLVMVLVMILVLLPACAKPAPAPAPAPAPKPAPAPAPKPAPKPVPKPVSAADFYKENRMTVIVGFSAGGGTDTAARILTAYWPDVTDGAVKIQNMPGGGGLLGVNTVYGSKPDGLTLGVHSMGSTAFPALFNDPGMKYDLSKLTYIGLFAQEPQGFGVGTDTPYESIADLQKAKGLKFGTSGRRHEMYTAQLIDLFGLDAVVIPGYKNSPETGLAIARGELDGMATSMGSIIDEVDKGFMKPPLLTYGEERSSFFPDTLTILELAKPSPEQQVFLDITMPTVKGRILYGANGIPEDRVEFLRDAMIKLTELSGYQKMAKARFGTVEPTLPGKELAAKIAKLSAIPKGDLDKFLAMVDSLVVK